MVNYLIKNISRNIEAVSFELGTRNVHHERNKICGAVAMKTVLPLVLSKLEMKVPVFVF